ncbi:hypothetical protein EI94DRAFT_1723596, partial [Lactarius quietus]
MEQTLMDAIRDANTESYLTVPEFQFKKKRLQFLRLLYLGSRGTTGVGTDQTLHVADAVLKQPDERSVLAVLETLAKDEKGILSRLRGFFRSTTGEEGLWLGASKRASSISDSEFLSDLRTIPVGHYLHEAVTDVQRVAYALLAKQVDTLVTGICRQILLIQKKECDKNVQREVEIEKAREVQILWSNFVRQVKDVTAQRSRWPTTDYLDHFEIKKSNYSRDTYDIRGRRESLQEDEIEYRIHLLHLRADESQKVQLDRSYVPTPILERRLTHSFRVSSLTVVKYAHLLEGGRILVGLINPQGNIEIYVESLSRIDAATRRRSFAKLFHRDKIGDTCLFATDESKRMLAIYSPAKMQLHIFVFDPERGSLRGMGSTIDLLPFYNYGESIVHACFVHGREEILFVDSTAQARIFSLIMLQPKPASVQLPKVPRAVYSSPDGSCALVVQEKAGISTVTAYHWTTFASTDGISITLPHFPVNLDAALLTSIVTRNNIHLIGLEVATHSCRSVILDITSNAAEFTFQEQRTKAPMSHNEMTAHNCLIDCHSEVWTRFPVVAEVKRDTITSSSERQQRTLTFVTDENHRPFSSYFSKMIRNFIKTSHKPTGGVLEGTTISTWVFTSFTRTLISNPEWPVSRFRAGEWLADLLCLIPIQIAITHQNRFVPLKDGVLSTELEKSLLGAEVDRIADSLSVGWYESIFQSYWATKPVKVVSSMGEQSVGKSFTLNHLLDTSFAGSAMRTTEGVWLSVSPTEDALIVALDFEAVHTLERSIQEDSLLVLFNAALSNLVLFRNNFALGRDITGLFQSFQSSASILDRESNPSLFQSRLLVIIKDVIDSDKVEVKKEFLLKFQKIVEDEQDSNFISRLHAGELTIIPWPVIESEGFYQIFRKVKKTLDRQPTSHPNAGEFLLTLKTLMAKLKANDWGAMSQNMAIHRTNSLLATLSNALETGLSEIYPDPVPLKNFDTDIVIEAKDTQARFVFLEPNPLQYIDDSKWHSDLVQYLTHLVDLRVAHVENWLESNIQRFEGVHASIEELRRIFDSAVIDLRASIEICRLQCGSCNLTCVRSSRSHKNDHDCLTNHTCIHSCSFCEGDGLPAPPCSQMYVCSNSPCRLAGVRLPNGKLFTCSGTCFISLDIEHTDHECEDKFCPASCRLCNRLCSGGHLHGLKSDQNHLCGQEHSCSASCSSGICEIQTRPQSIEATFTGRHETFRYTREIVLVAKSLPCAKVIEPGELRHPGPHIHTNYEHPFHFCGTRCRDCGYICTLPFGHHQQEHETSHGSMINTRWVIEGPDGTGLEIGGRKFSSNDDGGPMLCNLVCTSMGRHVHVDLCRGPDCHGPRSEHIANIVSPGHDQAKDWISHGLHWSRRDPYRREEQANFEKCDAQCSGAEHTTGLDGVKGQPSSCTLPIFHAPLSITNMPPGLGYVSNDGHHFACKNPALLWPAFHVSGSMSCADQPPLPNAPGANRIKSKANNRLGAVFSSLYGFWIARQATFDRIAQSRKDAYSLIFFDSEATTCIENDFTSSPEQLLTTILQHEAGGNTNFTRALKRAHDVMISYWSSERTPVVIFLSDGWCDIGDECVYGICRDASRRGKPLSFHSVGFGRGIVPTAFSSYGTRWIISPSSLNRMVEIAQEVQQTVPQDRQTVNIPSSFTDALDTIQLTTTFQGFAESLRKPRGHLFFVGKNAGSGRPAESSEDACEGELAITSTHVPRAHLF